MSAPETPETPETPEAPETTSPPSAPAGHATRPEGTVEDQRSPCLTNLVLLALVAGLGLWVWFGEGQTPPPPSDTIREIFPIRTAHEFHPMQSLGLELVRGDETLRLVREETEAERQGQATKTEEGHTAPIGWQMLVPVADRGDDTQLFRLLNRVQHATWQLTLADEKGLGQTTVVATITRKEGFPPITLTFGTPVGGQVGLKVEVPERPTRYFMVGAELQAEFSRPAWVWRRKVLFDVPMEQVAAVRAQVNTEGAARTIAVARGPRGWRFGSMSGDLAERGLAEELVEAVRLLRGATIHSNQADASELQALGLAPTPWASLEIDAIPTPGAPPKTARLLLGARHPERSSERYALLESRPGLVFTVQTGVFEDVFARDPALYLSAKLFPVEGGVEGVTSLGAQVEAQGPRPETRWRVELKDEGWRFVGEGAPLASKPAVEELIKGLLELRIGARLSPTPDELRELGLDAPRLRIELYEGAYRHVIEVGAASEEGYALRRLIPNPAADQAPLAFVYRVGLGEIPAIMGAAQLELLDPRIFSASSWDARKLELSGQAQEALFRASFDPSDPAQPQGPREWVFPDHPRADPERFKAYLKTFDEFNVQRYVALRDQARLADYGLERPEKLTIWINSFAEGARTLVPKELWIGAREGQGVYVTTPEATAIGLVDYRFRERLDDAFEKGQVLWVADPWQVKRVTIYREGLLALELLRPDSNWRWDGGFQSALLSTQALKALEKRLLDDEVLGRVVLGRVKASDQATLEATGLTKPRWRIELLVQPVGGEAQTHVLLIGNPTSGASSWAMAEGGDAIGSYKGIRALEAFVAAAEPPAPFPPR